MAQKIEPYPLQWPLAKPRTPKHKRKRSKFGTDGGRNRWGFGTVRDQLLAELERLRARDVVLSTDLQLRLDGLPRAGQAEPKDPGIAIYFRRKVHGELKSYVMANDIYDRLADNTRALVLTIESLRKIERHGSAELMEQAFTGFAALPPAQTGLRPWRDVLGLGPNATLEEAKGRYRFLVGGLHEDVGGNHDKAVELNDAMRRARQEFAEAG